MLWDPLWKDGMDFEKRVESTQTMLRSLENDEAVQEKLSVWDVLQALTSEPPTSRTHDSWVEIVASALQGTLGWSSVTYWRVKPTGDIELGFFHGRTSSSTDLLLESVATREIDMDLTCALLVFPILQEEHLVGVLQVEDEQADPLSADLLESLEVIQRVLSNVLSLVDDDDRTEEVVSSSSLVEEGFRLRDEIQGMTSFEHAACHVGEGLLSVLSGVYASLWLLQGDQMRSEYSFGRRDHMFHASTEAASVHRGQGSVGECWAAEAVVVVPDMREHGSCPRSVPARESGLRGGLFVPLISRGEVFGVMEVFDRDALVNDEASARSYRRLGALVGDALSRVREVEREQEVRQGVVVLVSALDALARGERVYAMDTSVPEVLVPVRETAQELMGSWTSFERELSGVIEAVNAGDLDARADLGDVQGMFRRLLSLVNGVMDGMGQHTFDVEDRVGALLGVLDAAAQRGDLTSPISVRGGDVVGRLGQGIHAFFRQLRGEIARLDTQSEGLVHASRELGRVSSSLELGSTQSANCATAASAASEQVSVSLQLVATSAEEVSASIGEISRQMASAMRVMSCAVERAEQAAQRVQSLKVSGEEISSVVKLIRSVADQTNLLALNATIEAARAGDAGKGFGVVANEVKELARETKRATEEISSKIETIQDDTRHSITSIEEIHQTIHQLYDIQSMIASAVERQNVMTDDIRRSMNEAAGACSLVSHEIAQVVREVERTHAHVGDTQNSAESLSRMAGKMQGFVRRFTV